MHIVIDKQCDVQYRKSDCIEYVLVQAKLIDNDIDLSGITEFTIGLDDAQLLVDKLLQVVDLIELSQHIDDSIDEIFELVSVYSPVSLQLFADSLNNKLEENGISLRLEMSE